MTEEEVKAVVKLYWEIVAKAAKALHGHEISYDGHVVKEQEVTNVFVTINGTLAATIECGEVVYEDIHYLPVPVEAVTC